jgi:hypothetical protein
MRLTINKKPYDIKPISELTFDEYNLIVIQSKAVDLPEYLSIMTGITPDELMNAQLKGASIPALYQQLINITDHNSVIKSNKKVIEFDGKIHLIEALQYVTFGQSYMFEVVNQNKKLNDFQKSVYALAISLTDSLDMGKITETYKSLCKMNWMAILPQAFFLRKKHITRRLAYIRLWLNCTFRLKSLRRKILTSRKKYQRLEKI